MTLLASQSRGWDAAQPSSHGLAKGFVSSHTNPQRGPGVRDAPGFSSTGLVPASRNNKEE